MTREELFRKLYEEEVRRDNWFKSLPLDINSAFFDNEYVNSLYYENSMLIEKVFDEHAESVFWFIYEWKPGYEVEFDGKTTKIYDIDGYINWMKYVEGFE
jgi:hypothetical protein